MPSSPEPRAIDGLSEIAAQYDAVLCDAWGVIHNGQKLFPGVAKALSSFKSDHGPVVIITNAPRLSNVIPAQLDRLGLPQDAYDRVVTSGDATRAAVAERASQPFYRLGPDKDQTLFEALPIEFTELDNAEMMLCTGLVDDMTETPEDYRDLLSAAAAKKIPMICANPDKVVKFGDKVIYCAGALGDLYEELGGEVILCGKPHTPIYAQCRAAVTELTDKPAPRLLAIGDGVQTDILGANREDIDVVFIADGIFSEESRGPDGNLDTKKLQSLLDAHGVYAKYALDGLRW